jgi:hypothetical protein
MDARKDWLISNVLPNVALDNEFITTLHGVTDEC